MYIYTHTYIYIYKILVYTLKYYRTLNPKPVDRKGSRLHLVSPPSALCDFNTRPWMHVGGGVPFKGL